MPKYTKVFDITNDWAAVTFENGTTGLVDGEGNIRKKLERNTSLRLMGNNILAITGKGNKTRYIDLRNDMEYKSCPTSVRFGSVELLKVGSKCYGRILQ